ncbi:amidase signature domain-containing protein [Calycina marina]|uniref:amidase n=1 Tax=Calycina marina TaxID=1763456 RepID=A0A9P7YY90_9HELO|nr:amidase signature domain-containing protein [Calycina marina]
MSDGEVLSENPIALQTIRDPATTKDHETIPKWKKVAARRRQEINSKIPAEYLLSPTLLKPTNVSKLVETCGLLTARELSIVRSSAVKLLESVHNRNFTAVEATTAFCKSAAIAHQATNCLALVMFEEALVAAAELDHYMELTGKPKGPLHGLSISVKEHVYLAGTPATSGFVAWADDVSPADSLIVRVLRDAGAVFHVKTTNPQGLMALETSSKLYGTTMNPYNRNLTPGGSSGGESALIAMRGSLLGIGTDIGGSIRVPAAFCGLYGLKPSVARLPHGGLSGAHGGMENIIGCVGPLATCIEDMRLFCDVVLSAKPWLNEPSLVELPWKRSIETPKTLNIGVMWDDGVVQPHPPITRALSETVSSLRKAGHFITFLKPTLHRELTDCINKMYLLDAGQEYIDILNAGEETATPLMQWIIDGSENKTHTMAESWKLNGLRNELQIAYAAQWNEAGIDALLCPTNPSVASAHGESTYWGYSSAFNILDYSAAVFPVSSVQENDTLAHYPRSKPVMGKEDARFNTYFGEHGTHKYRDAPVSLQLVTRRYREEALLGMLERLVADLHPPKAET